MEKVEKIELMRKRIEYFYNEHRLNAMESLSYIKEYYRFEDFVEFSMQNVEIIDYCFYLGDFCRTNRAWLSDCNFWRRYKFNGERNMIHCLIKTLLLEVTMKYPNQGRKIIEEIDCRLDERWYTPSDRGEREMKNGRLFLIYAFMAGLMNVTESEIDEYWRFREELMEEEITKMEESRRWDDDNYTLEDSLYDALGGNMDAIWNID